jgi:glyceraldehyde 3-phosphate dehydrogenase
VTVRVGINGFGRIGRSFLRAAAGRGADVEIVAVNDLASVEANANLLSLDSTQGRFEGVSVEGGDLVVQGRRIKVLAEREPSALPWKDLGVEVVLESTGRFTKRAAAAAHLEAGAEQVVVSAPCADADLTIVVGVNDQDFDPKRHQVVSNASCTTNCFVPMVKVLDDAFGVKSGLMTTVHAYTNDQQLLDLVHKDPRRARAAAVNIVPSSTGAARATSLVLAAMAGRLDGTSLRVPVPVGSITDFTAVLERPATKDEVNDAFRSAATSSPLQGILAYSEAPIVSSDIVGTSVSCTFDAPLTMVLDTGGVCLAKVFGWYDNEWGYSNRLVDLVELVGGARRPTNAR